MAVVPGTKTAIVELALVARRARRHDPAPRSLLPRLPVRGRPRRRRHRPAAARPGGRLAARPRHRAGGGGLFLNYPTNPCAVCAAPGTFEAAVAYADRTGTAIVHDAAYIDLVFDGRAPESFLATAGAKEVGVELWTMSKTYGMAGWRIGFVLGNAEIVERLNLLGDHCRVGMLAPLQHAAVAALTGSQESVEERRASYERRRDRLAAALPGPVVCEGTFYVWLRLPEGLTAERLLAEHRVALAPGEGFGRSGAGWARLSLAVSDETLERGIERLVAAFAGYAGVKIGIVVPFSWSYWGGVVEHSENQAAALRARGHEVKILMGNDPPGIATRLLHPRAGRHGELPEGIIPVGRSVVVPANGSLPNIVLSPRSIVRVRQVLAEERFDLVHLHEPMTPGGLRRRARVRSLPDRRDLARCRRSRLDAWRSRRRGGYLMERIDVRIAVSRMAAESAARWLGPGFEIVPNGVVVPEHAEAGRPRAPDRLHRPPRRTQGAARAAARVARDPPPHRRPAPPDRHRSAPVPAAALAAALRRGRDRRARDRDATRCASASSRARSCSSRRRSAARASAWC